ncbi:hEGF domain containing protein [Trichuris trichiura]|uniref:HEGF domain containing protein n=1 Tax=Trichuris trichiura TaxID=36087 RepID=A0A077ZC98_TRITR|nr:hEGF domain containing protein [Trichuris trichiura]
MTMSCLFARTLVFTCLIAIVVRRHIRAGCPNSRFPEFYRGYEHFTLNESDEAKKCYTFVPFHLVGATLNWEMAKLNNYCKEAFKNGYMANYEALSRTVDATGNLQTTEGLSLIMSDRFLVFGGSNVSANNEAANNIFFVNHTVAYANDSTAKIINCTFDPLTSDGSCSDLRELLENKSRLLKMSSTRKTFCLKTHLFQNDFQVSTDRTQFYPCAMKMTAKGFICIHDSYKNCRFSFHQGGCLRTNQGNSCERNLIVDIWELPELPYGYPCPANHSHECNCANESSSVYTNLAPNFPCLNGATKQHNADGTIKCVCAEGYSGRRCQHGQPYFYYYVRNAKDYRTFQPKKLSN